MSVAGIKKKTEIETEITAGNGQIVQTTRSALAVRQAVLRIKVGSSHLLASFGC
jgi:hypothetical protein